MTANFGRAPRRGHSGSGEHNDSYHTTRRLLRGEHRAAGRTSPVARLIALLGGNTPETTRPVRVAMPGLRDIAEATGLTVETVSRVIARMRSAGTLRREGRGAIELAPGFLSQAGLSDPGS